MEIWEKEFDASFAVPAIISSSLNDSSWHNDVCPSFVRADDDASDPALILWCGHPVPMERELGCDMPRFAIVETETENTLLYTDDAAEAVKKMLDYQLKGAS